MSKPIGEVFASHQDDYTSYLRLAGHSPRTVETYLRWLRRFDEEVGLLCVDAPRLVRWIANPGWSQGTRKGVRTALRSWFGWAKDQGLVDSDPTGHLPKIKVPKTLPRPAPDDVWSAAWLRAGSWQERAMLLLACHAGLRRSEIAALHRDWIEGDVLRVRGKGDKTRLVPMSLDLVEQLSWWPERQEYFLPGRWGGHVEASFVGKRLSFLLGDGWSGHTLRHRAASMAYEESADIAAVQDMLGHESADTTRIYTRVSLSHVERAVSAGARLSPAGGSRPAPVPDRPEAPPPVRRANTGAGGCGCSCHGRSADSGAAGGSARDLAEVLLQLAEVLDLMAKSKLDGALVDLLRPHAGILDGQRP